MVKQSEALWDMCEAVWGICEAVWGIVKHCEACEPW